MKQKEEIWIMCILNARRNIEKDYWFHVLLMSIGSYYKQKKNIKMG